MKIIVNDKDYLKENSKLSNGKVSLMPVKGTSSFLKGLIFFVFFFATAPYIVPNPNQIQFSNAMDVFNMIRMLFTTIILIAMYVRVVMIFKTTKPWRYGLEFTTYFCLSLVLLGLSTATIGYVMTIYLFEGDSIYFYSSLVVVLVSILLNIKFFWTRKLKTKENKVAGLENKILKYQFIGGITAAIVFFISRPQEETIGYIVFLLFPIFTSFGVAPLLFNVYSIKYRDDINFDEYYRIFDNIDTSKEYPPNYFCAKKKKGRK